MSPVIASGTVSSPWMSSTSGIFSVAGLASGGGRRTAVPTRSLVSRAWPLFAPDSGSASCQAELPSSRLRNQMGR